MTKRICIVAKETNGANDSPAERILWYNFIGPSGLRANMIQKGGWVVK